MFSPQKSHKDGAREILLEEGINPTIVNARFLKPIDKELLDRIFKDHKKVVTIEDNVITGGFSTNINKFIIDNKYDIDIINIALPCSIRLLTLSMYSSSISMIVRV